MSKFWKRTLMALSICLCLFIFTSCTKSFSSNYDVAVLYGQYIEGTVNTTTNERENGHQQGAIDAAKNAGFIIPDNDFWTYIDSSVNSSYDDLVKNGYDTSKYSYIPESYYSSHMQYLNENVTDKSNLVDTFTIKSIIRYTGENGTLWANFDKWTEDYLINNPTKAPTSGFINSYKTTISTGVGTTITGLTPKSGYFNGVYVEGKTWGQAFSEYGFLEGLLVYPIGWLIYTFTVTFGVNGGGQILAIFLVTLIVRFIIVLFSMGSYSTQMKMAELQPKLQMLQSKYPNSQTNPYEKQQMAAEQMRLYKENKVHPFRQILVLIVQFPVFICVWGALQGSAILTQGSLFGLKLASRAGDAVMAGGSETPAALILLILMAIAQFFATLLPTWMQSYRKKKIVGDKTVKVEENPSANMMKYMPYIMLVVIVFMSVQLPAAMGIYWFFGALISILQTVITEIVMAFKRGRKNKNKFTPYKKVKDKKTMKIR